MSASDKKKLRKELTAASMTEKQQTEMKQQKKMKAYTLTFVIAMVLVVAIVLVSVLQMPVRNILMKNTTAVTIGDYEMNAAEFNYYYADAVTEFYNQFSSYGEYADLYFQIYYGLNTGKTLGSQVYDSKTGATWADYFIDSATDAAKWTLTMYNKAMAEGFKLTEEEQEAMDSMESYINLYATFGGHASADAYLKAIYGSSADMDTYIHYYEVCTIASAYASDYADGLEYTDEQYREYEADRYHEFSSYSWYSYYVNVSSYLPKLEKGEDGKTREYTDEEKAAALAAAKADAEKLVASNAADLEALNDAINALEINKPEEGKTDAKPIEATEYEDVLYSSMSVIDEVKEWLSSKDRKAGDLSFIEKTTGTDDAKTTKGFFVLFYVGCEENKINVGTVRHLLVKFQGGTKDDKTGETVYSELEKNNAKLKADKFLKEFLNGEKVDEDAFIELVKKNTEDTASKSTGGLIENIHPDAGYVESFTEWAIADHKPGDTGVIESPYGYHVMYYVEANELNYRDMLIKNALVERDYKAWEEAALKNITVTEGDMKFVNRDYVMAR